ncbi:S8 family serine peptidase [Streptomyces sp. NPDC004610]|uniref:S8 family serine peptidase n=1 Tax=unclassified Streptomyces TaxID=2593676 RepID=UPI0033A12295
MGALVGALAAVSTANAPAAMADTQADQWYLAEMQAEKMWQVSTGEGVKVAVIDSGVNADTPSLKGQVLVDDVPESVAYNATKDYSGHGTSMAELIAGTGAGGGVKGLAPGAGIVPYRVSLEGLEEGPELDKTPEPAEALRAAADTDAKIINISFGGMASDEDQEAVRYAASKGKLVIAAVGNDGFTDQPAMYPYVIGIGSVNASFEVSDFSSHGFADLMAPGEGIPTWCDETFTSYCKTDGTSQATALASAAAALVWSAHPDWTVNQVTRALLDTASRGWPKDEPSRSAGYGFIRPRVVLADPSYDAGAPDVDPLEKVNKGDLLSKSAQQSPSSPAPSGASQAPDDNTSADGPEAAGSSTEATASGDDSNTLWITLGAAAAVIVVGGTAFAVLRARRAG